MPPAQAGKGKQNARVRGKHGVKSKADRGDEEIRSKQALLDQLTRQAEENTRMLERERAALLALGIDSASIPQAGPQSSMFEAPYAVDAPQPTWQPPGPVADLRPGRNPPAFPSMHPAAPPHILQPTDLNLPPLKVKPAKHHGPIQAHINRTHNFLNRPAKVFDPSQVPGLGGGAPQEPSSPFFNHHESPRADAPGPGSTFPDSPSFYEGMVFSIPMAVTPPVDQPQGPPEDHLPPVPAPPPQRQAPGRRAAVRQSQLSRVSRAGDAPPGEAAGPMAAAQPNQAVQQAHFILRPPAHDEAPPLIGPGVQETVQVAHRPGRRNDRAERESKQEAYRRELEEQIRVRKALQAAEAEAARQPPPGGDGPLWGPGAHRRGGGGDPLRDAAGGLMTDLRGAAARAAADTQWQQQGPGTQGPGPTMHDWGQQQNPTQGMLGRRNAPRLTLDLPDDPYGAQTAQPLQPLWQPPTEPLQFPQVQGQTQQTAWLGPGQPLAPPGWGPNGPDPGTGPPAGPVFLQPTLHGVHVPPGPHGGAPLPPMPPDPNSPGAAGRKFMGAMAQLRAGPSEEQQHHAAQQRAQLLRDLDEQVRQKKDREARKKAEEDAIRMKEEAELQIYYQRVAAQKDEEKRTAQAEAARKEAAVAAAQSGGGAGGDLGDRGVGRPRRGNKKLIEADWLDGASGPVHGDSGMQAVPQGYGVLHHEQGGPARGGQGAVSGGGGAQVGEVSPGGGRAVRFGRQFDSGLGPERSGGGAGVGRSDQVGAVLTALQQEQARLREEFSRQAASLQDLAHSAGAVVLDRAQAWRDVERVRGVLAAGPSGGGGGGDTLRASDDWDRDQFVVSTHLLPRDVNVIPSRLCTPLEAEWAAEREPLLLDKGAAQGPALYSYVSPVGLEMEDAAGLDQLYHGGGGVPGYYPESDPYPRSSVSAGHGHGRANRSPIRRPAGAPGQHRPLSRLQAPTSQIPRAPRQQGWAAPAGQQNVPASRYSSFFNLEEGGRGGRVSAMGSRMQPVAEHGLPGKPALAFGRRAVVKPPPSPAILRGDHLPSPDRKLRAPVQPRSAHKGGATGLAQAGGRQAVGVLAQPPPRGPESARRYMQARRASATGDAPATVLEQPEAAPPARVSGPQLQAEVAVVLQKQALHYALSSDPQEDAQDE